MTTGSIKKFIFTVVVGVSFCLIGYVLYQYFFSARAKLKNIVLYEIPFQNGRENLEEGINNLTNKECKEINKDYRNYKGFSSFKTRNPKLAEKMVLHIVQDIFYKNVLKRIKLVEDTVSINYDTNTIRGINFLSPGEYSNFSDNGSYLSNSTSFIYDVVLVWWELPTLLKRIGVSDSIINKRIDHNNRYLRELKLDILYFKEISEIYNKGLDVNSSNILKDLIKCHKNDTYGYFQDTTLELNFNNNLFKKQKLIMYKHKKGDKYLICCYGSIESLGIILSLQHGKTTGKLEKSIEIAKTVWESFHYW